MTELTIDQLIALAAKTEDQTKTNTTIDYEPPPAGLTYGRLISYVEMGKQPQRPFKGKAKPPAEEVKVVFELLHKKNMHEYEHDGEKKIRYDQMSLTLTKQFGTKAKYKKLFNAMTYGRADIVHMAQMLGNPFKITVFHNKVEATADKPERTYVNLFDKDGACGIGHPSVLSDPLDPTTVVQLPVPPAVSPLQIFLWSNPTKASWDSLFIDGTRTVKNKEGVEEEHSKNWVQAKIASAVNFEGSPLQLQLGGIIDLPMGGNVTEGDEVQDEIEEAEKAAKVAEAKPASPEFEMTSDVGEEVPFVPDAPKDTSTGSPAPTVAATASASSPSEDEDEKALRLMQEKIAAKKAAAVAQAAAASQQVPQPTTKASSVDADLAALGLLNA